MADAGGLGNFTPGGAMLIEKTTLIQFDEVADRARILNVFKGRRQKDLLKALDLMVAGDFLALARAVAVMPEELLEYMAIPMQEIIVGVVNQKIGEKAYAEGGRLKTTAKERELMSMRGTPTGQNAVMYPRFVAVDSAPAPAEVPVSVVTPDAAAA